MRWWVFVHIVAALAFAMSHGSTVAVALKLRGERDRTRVRALLELSSVWLNGTFISTLVLLITGVVAGFLGRHWGKGWIWTSIGILVVLVILMSVLGTRYYDRLRVVVGVRAVYAKKGEEPPSPGTDEELEQLLSSSRPLVLTAIGTTGLLLLLWLMVLRPF